MSKGVRIMIYFRAELAQKVIIGTQRMLIQLNREKLREIHLINILVQNIKLIV